MHTTISVLLAIVGLLLYGFSKDAKPAEIGRITFFCGLLCFLLSIGSKWVNPFGG